MLAPVIRDARRESGKATRPRHGTHNQFAALPGQHLVVPSAIRGSVGPSSRGWRESGSVPENDRGGSGAGQDVPADRERRGALRRRRRAEQEQVFRPDRQPRAAERAV